jgi:broad specificity phosphatase PhoE
MILVRHAQSLANAGGATMPNREIPLSSLGRQQAQRLVSLLPRSPERVIVSGMLRTQQTAAPYCAHTGVEAAIDETLNEFSLVDHNLIQGMDGAQRRAFVHDYWNRPNPQRRWGAGADTFVEFVGRVDTFLASVQRHEPSTIVFGHGIWLAMLKWRLMGNSAITPSDMLGFRAYSDSLEIANCAVFSLSEGPNGWQIDESIQRPR